MHIKAEGHDLWLSIQIVYWSLTCLYLQKFTFILLCKIPF